ncbi:hypothetical protein FNV43_RR04615 [Rhamnella rubrinervis]|uniref:Uncharacterized protein n=1 Tax=Rhamnella rubrinervis TaxID=2594499 RepID=A0A8K0HMA2_9ROSA|nr:hypothetical protein FNV43_RR04615 [Rhamnella rubrinervis]
MAGDGKEKWIEKPKLDDRLATDAECTAAAVAEDVTKRLEGLSISGHNGQANVSVQTMPFGGLHLADQAPVRKSYGTVSGACTVKVEEAPVNITGVEIQGQSVGPAAAAQKSTAVLSKLFKGNLLESFTVDNSTYALGQVRATFYPKFENEKSDQEVRTRMIEMVSKGLATLEVSLKHSGSLFMYAGHEGGAYAKNSFGNIYTAVGVFVLGRMFQDVGAEAAKSRLSLMNFLRNRMCISMELVTAVLGDHGQRSRRLWKSVTSFFAAFDVLCEEGTATPVCKALDEVADISVPGSKDHIKVQGEILEGLVARIVSHESSKHMEKVLKDFPLPTEEAGLDLGPNLRDICATNRSDEKQQIKALLQSVGASFCPDYSDWFGNEAGDAHSRSADRSVLSKFLQSHPADFATTKLQVRV